MTAPKADEKAAWPPRIRLYKPAFNGPFGPSGQIKLAPFNHNEADPIYWNNFYEFVPLREHSALIEKAVAEARAAAFETVLEEAQKLYEEEMDSDPSDYFYTKKAVELAKARAAAEEKK